MLDPPQGMLPEEWSEICRLLKIPYDESENEDSGLQGAMENLPSQEGFEDFPPQNSAENENSELQGEMDILPSHHIPPSYAENEDSGVQENLLDTLGQEDLYPSNYAEQYSSTHIEDSILESKKGGIKMKIEPIEIDEVARYSEIQKCMHVKRTGLFKIRLICEGVPSSDDSTFFIRLMLVREHEGYTHMPVDKVCQKHQDQEEEELKNHVIRYSKDYNFYPAIYVEGYRPSIVFEVPAPENRKIDVTLGMFFKCNDSCVTSQILSESKSMTHKARDLRLVHTLEIRRNFKMEILQRSSMSLWIKAVLDKTHLIREQRRGPQGGLAQKLKRENSEPETSTSRAKKRKARKVGVVKTTKVPASMETEAAPCPQLEPPVVDHMELLLSERVYHEEDQVAAFNNLSEEMLRKIFAWNQAVINNLQ